MQALLGYTSEARWIRHAHAHLGHLFRYLPGQPGYNRRLRAAAGLITTLIRMLAADTSLWTDDVWVADSTPVECGRSRETARRSDLAGWAEYGYCASHSRYFWGLRLHLLTTLHGLPIGFALAGAKADERQVLLDILADPALTAGRDSQIIIARQELLRHAASKPPWPMAASACSARPARANGTGRVRRRRQAGRRKAKARRRRYQPPRLRPGPGRCGLAPEWHDPAHPHRHADGLGQASPGPAGPSAAFSLVP